MDSFSYFLQSLVAVILWVAIWIAPFCVILWVAYEFSTARLRRHERARFLLDLIETNTKHGHRIEDAFTSIAANKDSSMGVRFHLLAAWMEKGLPLQGALAKVPRFLPPQIAAMLNAGLQIGDVSKVMPACRQLGKDAVSQTRCAVNYLLLLAFVGVPTNILILAVLQIYIFPQFTSVLRGMGIMLPTGMLWIIRHSNLVLTMQLLLCLLVWIVSLAYFGGPFFGWLSDIFPAISDGLILYVPWRRKRLQRDFSTMLAILLDAGMPEPEAITLAADCTSNNFFRRRAKQAVEGLQQGMKLPEVIQLIDDSGEFHWRLVNALQNHGGFLKSIAGWNESLDAKAFQQEQATAQAVTTGLVLLNGAMVGVIVVSVFSLLVAIINQGVSW